MVTDISPYLADGQSVESLRELATRYRLKYLVAMNTRYSGRSYPNRWGWGSLSLVGIPLLPAYTLRTAGLTEATLLDVRIGTFLFTTQVHVTAVDKTNPFRTDEKLAELQRAASRTSARYLAQLFVEKCSRLVADAERHRKAAGIANLRGRGPEPKAAISPAGAPGEVVRGGA